MHVFGYAFDDERETPRRLREATLACQPAELDRLVAFLEHVRAEVARRGPGAIAPCHFHLRDWDRGTSGSADLIIALGA